jgi:hypothetical protein
MQDIIIVFISKQTSSKQKVVIENAEAKLRIKVNSSVSKMATM